MDFKKAIVERRLRAAVKAGNGRALLDVMASDSMLVERVLSEMGPAAGPALVDAIRVARTEDEMSAAIYKAGQSTDPRALDEVRRVLREGAPAARVMAITTASVHGTVDDTTLMADCLKHPDPDVRRSAFETLSALEGFHGEGYLPASVAAVLSAERADRAEAERAAAEAERAAAEAELAGPFTTRSAAKALVRLCNEIDATYSDPIPPDADDRRASLREDIARVGNAVYDQGGEDFMGDVVKLVALASSHGSYVSREWVGIGGWMG